jgi:hypothetical protein
LAQGDADDAKTISVAEHARGTRDRDSQVKWPQGRIVVLDGEPGAGFVGDGGSGHALVALFFVRNAIDTAAARPASQANVSQRTGAVFGIMRQSAKLRNSVISRGSRERRMLRRRSEGAPKE